MLRSLDSSFVLFFFQAEDGIRYSEVTGVQTCALPISPSPRVPPSRMRVRRSAAFRPFANGWRSRTRSIASPSQSSTSPRWPQTQLPQAAFLGTSQVAPSSSASSSPSTKGRLPVWRLSNGYATLLGRSERVRYQARSRHRRHQRHGPSHRSATYCWWCDGGDHRTLAVARRSEGRIICPG